MIRFGVLTISDRSSRGERADLSGPALVDEITRSGWTVARSGLVPDEQQDISRTLIEWADSGQMDILLTTGGTGFSPRDVTPEATLAVIQRQAPGLAERIRDESMKITPHAMLSRAVAGIRGKTLIINLPGSPKAAVESIRVVSPVLEHAVELMTSISIPDAHHEHRE
jgi:molybdenum cofactor synthesis domain-containing protein